MDPENGAENGSQKLKKNVNIFKKYLSEFLQLLAEKSATNAAGPAAANTVHPKAAYPNNARVCKSCKATPVVKAASKTQI